MQLRKEMNRMADMLSQEEIDALLNGGPSETSSSAPVASLTPEELDAIGEIGNISMGTAATTLFTLLGQKVTITTPRVFETNIEELAENFVDPCVLINIKYRYGIQGVNLLILKENDVKIITDLMMGGDGTNLSADLTDLHLSAISEAMNQMIGSASTSLSEMLGDKIDISPPEAIYGSLNNIDLDSFEVGRNEVLTKIAFKMTVGDLIDSEIMQIIPIPFARQMVNSLMKQSMQQIEASHADYQAAAAPTQTPPAQQHSTPAQAPHAQQSAPQAQQMPHQSQQGYAQQMPQRQAHPVNAMPLEYESFDDTPATVIYATDIDLIKDVPMEITVELGRAVKKISDILDFGIGSVIELDKLVGEALNILANGKVIAKGEVVVVDENYGIRITEILTQTRNHNG